MHVHPPRVVSTPSLPHAVVAKYPLCDCSYQVHRYILSEQHQGLIARSSPPIPVKRLKPVMHAHRAGAYCCLAIPVPNLQQGAKYCTEVLNLFPNEQPRAKSNAPTTTSRWLQGVLGADVTGYSLCPSQSVISGGCLGSPLLLRSCSPGTSRPSVICKTAIDSAYNSA